MFLLLTGLWFLVTSHQTITAIKKFELDIAYVFDFLLFGIVSQEKAYRLAWYINKTFPYDFVREDDYEIELSGRACSFQKFVFTHEENHTTYYLLANKDEGAVLMPELRNFDFLLTVNGALEFFDEERLKQDFTRMQGVQLIYNIETDSLRSKQNLVYLY